MFWHRNTERQKRKVAPNLVGSYKEYRDGIKMVKDIGNGNPAEV